jgi:hypothetical protein
MLDVSSLDNPTNPIRLRWATYVTVELRVPDRTDVASSRQSLRVLDHTEL